MKVEQFENKNQFVIKGNGKIIFQSYDSIIAEFDTTSDTLTIGKDWNFSKTTSKHFYSFLNNYVGILNPNEKKSNKAQVEKAIADGKCAFSGTKVIYREDMR